MTKLSGGLVLALAVAVGLAASPLQAQRGPGLRGQAAGPNMGLSLDVLLENQEKLELTGDQLRELEGLKATMDGEVAPLAEEMKALREQIWAGEVDRNEGSRAMQALRGEFLTASAPLQGRVQEILTVEQHRTLQSEMRQGRPGQGRGGMAMQGRGGMAKQGRGGMAFRGRGGAFQGRRPAMGLRRGAPGVPRIRRDTVPDPQPNFDRSGGIDE
jgi:Spy/CpxP family protein refolding chaperone